MLLGMNRISMWAGGLEAKCSGAEQSSDDSLDCTLLEFTHDWKMKLAHLSPDRDEIAQWQLLCLSG